MSKLAVLRTLVCFVLVFSFLDISAQSFSCTDANGIPTIQDTLHHAPIGLNQLTPDPSIFLTQTADPDSLPNMEYLIVFRGQPAIDYNLLGPDTIGGGGDVIIGTSPEGRFFPQGLNRYGITVVPGDTIELLPIGFNITQAKMLTDFILFGSAPNLNFAPCCFIFDGALGIQGFCDSLNASGIFSSDDVTSLEDVLLLYEFGTYGRRSELSAEGLTQIINNFNNYNLPDGCGPTVLPVCHGIDTEKRYRYEIGGLCSGPDPDGDQIPASCDNCPDIPNPYQFDQDEDLFGFACDCNDGNPNDSTLLVFGSPVPPGDYQANSLILSGDTLSTAGPVTFKAGDSILLGPGFFAPPGADFRAFIQTCMPPPPPKQAQEAIASSPSSTRFTEALPETRPNFRITPNPTAGSITLQYQLQQREIIQISLYDGTGRPMAILLDHTAAPAGTQETLFDLSRFSAGLYYLVLQTAGERSIGKVVLMK